MYDTILPRCLWQLGKQKTTKKLGSMIFWLSHLYIWKLRSEPHHRRGSHPHPPRFFPRNDFVWPLGSGQKHHAALYVSWRWWWGWAWRVGNLRGVRCWPNAWGLLGDCLGISELRTTMSNCDTSMLRMQAEKAACAMKVPWGDLGGDWQQLSYW
jgi:hypothetical protein